VLGLASVLTDQGMEGITAFVPPAAPRPPKPQPASAASQTQDAGEGPLSRITRQTWVIIGVVAALLVTVLLGYGLVRLLSDDAPAPRAASPGQSKPAPTRSGAVKEVPSAAPAPPASVAVDAQPPVSSPDNPVQAPPPPVTAETPPPAPINPKPTAAARPPQPASESAQAIKPEWKGKVRSIGQVDAQTERSTMVILDAMHAAQERQRAASAPANAPKTAPLAMPPGASHE